MIKKDRLIKLTQKTISYNTVNPPGNELALGKFIEKDMRSLGLDVKIVSYAKNRPNIIATLKGTWPRKKASKKAILLTPHYDTVPFGTGWTTDPLGGEIKGGKLYGRGASDDKGNLASCMEVMRSLVEDKVKLKKDVIMAATVDEETGSHFGIVPLLKKKVLKPGFALVMDSTEFDAVTAQKGLFHGKITIKGVKAHGAYNWRGENAIEKCAKVITRLTQMNIEHKKHPLLHTPTINIGTIKGGDKVNIVADTCEIEFDIRFAIGQKHTDVLKIMRREIEKVTKKYKIEIHDVQQPYEIGHDHPFVKTYLKICRRMGNKARCKGSEGATVITFFQHEKIPAFATGWGAHGTLHTTDEYIYVKSLYRGTQVLEQYIKEYDNL